MLSLSGLCTGNTYNDDIAVNSPVTEPRIGAGAAACARAEGTQLHPMETGSRLQIMAFIQLAGGPIKESGLRVMSSHAVRGEQMLRG